MSVSIPADGGLLNPQPKLFSSFRRFGRCDAFKPVGASSTSVGSRSIGKVNIDCQFLFKRSRWGTLEGLPAGIMYLNLHFGLPQDCKVRDATVTVTLDEEDPCLKPYSANNPPRVLHHSGAAVQITEWYGPQSLGGEKKSAFVTSKTKFVPEANVLGYGMGGLGHERSKTFKKEARWSFNGQLLRGKRTSTYTSLRWHLTENDVDGQSFHSPKFRTAFAFEHSGQPFLMKLEIEGRLEKWYHQAQSRLKFGMDGAKEGKVVTLVDFEDYRKFPHGLDSIARGLPRAMEMENLVEIPVEVPDSIPGASFQQLSPVAPPHSSPDTTPHIPPQDDDTSNPQTLGSSEIRPLLEAPGQPQSSGGEVTVGGRSEQQIPTAEDYRRVLLALSRPNVKDILPEHSTSITSSNSTTLASFESTTEGSGKAQNRTSAETPITTVEKTRSLDELLDSGVDRDTMVKILTLPGIIAFLQFLANLMGVFGSGSLGPTPKIDDDRGIKIKALHREENGGARHVRKTTQHKST